jgi:hypothetical protein
MGDSDKLKLHSRVQVHHHLLLTELSQIFRTVSVPKVTDYIHQSEKHMSPIRIEPRFDADKIFIQQTRRSSSRLEPICIQNVDFEQPCHISLITLSLYLMADESCILRAAA